MKATPIFEGILQKRSGGKSSKSFGSVVRKYEARFFVLTADSLSWYATDVARSRAGGGGSLGQKPKGALELSSSAVLKRASGAKGSKGSFIVSALVQAEAEADTGLAVKTVRRELQLRADEGASAAWCAQIEKVILANGGVSNISAAATQGGR
eukprot:SAG11_NODE_11532_length_754_cov_1.340458_1_plen_153_part_00